MSGYVYVQTPELNSESGDWVTNHLIRRVCESPDLLHFFRRFSQGIGRANLEINFKTPKAVETCFTQVVGQPIW